MLFSLNVCFKISHPMQKSILIPLVAISALIGCDDQNSLSSAQNNVHSKSVDIEKKVVIPEWAGKYQGVTPCLGCTSRCEECPGMAVDLELKPDQTFVLNRISLSGHNEIESIKGPFKFNSPDSKMIELAGVSKRNLILVDLEHQLLEIREDLTANGFVEYEDFSLHRNS